MGFEKTSLKLRSTLDRQRGAPAQRRASVDKRSMAHQRGVTLVLSLIFLLLLTILGVTAMSTNSLQEKMAGNMRDKDVAFQASEAALRAAEGQVLQIGKAAVAVQKEPVPDATGSSGIWLMSATDVTNDAWWPGHSLPLAAGSVTGVAQPRYLIEQQAFVADFVRVPGTYGTAPGVYFYRLTGRATGVTNLAQTMLQETYRVRYK